MNMSLSTYELSQYVSTQLNHFFPDSNSVAVADILPTLKRTLERVEYCFSHIRKKYFYDGKNTLFNHLNSDQYAMFLYLFSNTQYHSELNLNLATKIYYLNKLLHSIDVYYEVELPNIFVFGHCVGTVLGRAKYADYFAVGQNCTVGNNRGIYPTFKEGVVMHSGSMVVGNSLITSDSHISAHTFIRNQDVLESNSVVIGRSPNLIIKPSQKNVKDSIFRNIS